MGVTDVIEARDSTGAVGRAYVNVISSSALGASGKAVVLAGRKPNDPLWETTNNLSHFIYQMLLFRGFSKENVRYLNPVVNQDVDGNGSADDIYAASSRAALEEALTTFAAGSPQLFVYLIDHGLADAETGTNGSIRCNETEVVYASEVAAYLDALQETGGVTTITLVVDCCQSGSFLPPCSGAPAGKARVVVCSTSSLQKAFFSRLGLVSFTNSFVSGLYSGLSVGEAFDLAAGAMSGFPQKAIFDDDGDGIYKKDLDGAIARSLRVGPAFIAGADRPQIGTISPNRMLSGGGTEGTIWAGDVSSVYPVERVWAAVAAPGFIPEARLDPSEPVLSLPEIDLDWNGANQRHEVTTNTFTQMGAYVIYIYARDIWGGVSYPKITYINQTESDERFGIVCGDGAYDSNSPWAWSDYLANQAWQTARARWFTDDRIDYLSSAPRPEVDASPTETNLDATIIGATGVAKLTLYLVGSGNALAFDLDGDGAASDPDDLTPAKLDGYLDALQNSGDTLVLLFLDFNDSGAWLSALQPPAGKQRIIVTSCSGGEASWCEAGGALSFSSFFFSRLFNGVTVLDAYNWTRTALAGITNYTQFALLDDDGSGDWNRSLDGVLARLHYFGAAFVTGAETPTIGNYARDVMLTSNQATLWASSVHAPAGIESIFAYVIHSGATPTDDQTVRVDLAYNAASDRWEAVYYSFDPTRHHTIVYFVQDRDGLLSDPYVTTFDPEGEDDIYDRLYNDDTSATLNFISSGNWSQEHNFWSDGDEDWLVFNASSNSVVPYEIYVRNQGEDCDAAIYLYHESDLTNPILVWDSWGAGGPDELVSWHANNVHGTIFLRIKQSDSSFGLSGSLTSYTLQVFVGEGQNAGLATISGTATTMGVNGGVLQAGDGTEKNPPFDPIYLKPRLSVPAGALSGPTEIGLTDPGDVGDDPWYAPTVAWLADHPGNASIVQFLTRETLNFQKGAELRLQFIDDGPTENGFTVDDLPPGVNASDMRIHHWTGSEWQVLPEPQVVIGDTVLTTITALTGGGTVYYTTSGSALSGLDYAALPGAVTFDPSAPEASVPVLALADHHREQPETLHLTLTSCDGADLAGSGTVHTVTIEDPGQSAGASGHWTLFE
ncbi:hypothetical protein HQ520_14495 [bacterium]|nr:hypothetical protein [bacterium]